jgi:hypothetical protein
MSRAHSQSVPTRNSDDEPQNGGPSISQDRNLSLGFIDPVEVVKTPSGFQYRRRSEMFENGIFGTLLGFYINPIP